MKNAYSHQVEFLKKSKIFTFFLKIIKNLHINLSIFRF
jgi:hypothetical protein